MWLRTPASLECVTPQMTKRDRGTEIDLLRAAEKLFAARGVDDVSLREIAAAAGQGNHSAVLYHFGDKRTLLNALLARHSDPIANAWLAMLGHLRDEGRDSLEELIGMMVRPLVRKLDDPDGGADYLLIVAQLVNSRTFPVTDLPAANAPGILAVSGSLMRHAGPIRPYLLPLRMLRVAAVLYSSIASYHRLCTAGIAIPRDEFVDDLIGSLVAVIGGGRQPSV